MEGFQVTYWMWWAAAVVLAVLEMMVPGAMLIWFGAAAAVMGFILFFVPDMGWDYQLATFALLALLSAGGARLFLKRHPIHTDRPLLNRRAAQYVGQVATLAEAIENGVGRVKLGDTVWRCVGPELPAGAHVRITGVDGSTLLVESHSAGGTPAA